MNRILSNILAYAFLSLHLTATAQQSDILSLEAYQDVVRANYPLIKKADLYDDITEAYRLKGAGTLDPKLISDYDGKEFKGTNYFRRWTSEIKVPTRLPVDFSVGYENNSGAFLNDEASIPDNGLIYGTVNISLLRGLIFDEQRYHLQASELDANKSQIERQLVIREIIIQSINAYIEWAAAYDNLQGYRDYEQAVIVRHQNIVELYINGDKPAIDTIESRVNWNTATKERLVAYNSYLQKKQKLNLFLWDENENPLSLVEEVTPQRIQTLVSLLEAYGEITNPAWAQDPLVRKKQNQVQAYDLQNRLVKEMLKPQLDLKLNTIYSLGDENIQLAYGINDYKIGATVELPLRNRKGRGELQLNAALKEQSRLDQEYYEAKLANDYLFLYNSRTVSQALIENANEKINNSLLLYKAEELKFSLGESSVFILNHRERKLLESRIEAIKSYKIMSLLLNQFYYLQLGQVKTLK